MRPEPWRALSREPIVHFAIAAGLLFSLYAVVAPKEKPTIRVDEATVEALMRERAAITLHPSTDQDRQDIVETYIREEILLREAKRRGLDQTPRIRMQLIQLMSHALVPEGPKPSEEELRRFFDRNRSRFERPAALSLAQILFAGGKTVPDGLVDRLNGRADPAGLGDFDMALGSTIRRASADNLVGLFGRDATVAILAIGDDRWHGPFRSARGAHLIRVVKRYPPEMPTYEQVAYYVAEEWELARQSEAIAREVKVLGRNYTIERSP
jgi:hypothetical protein